MITTLRNRRAGACALGLVILTGAVGPVLPAVAQTRHHRNFAQKHPTLTGIGAGVGAYALAKKTGKNRVRAGRRPNFAQRHPVLSGVAAAAVAHHYAKKHR